MNPIDMGKMTIGAAIAKFESGVADGISNPIVKKGIDVAAAAAVVESSIIKGIIATISITTLTSYNWRPG